MEASSLNGQTCGSERTGPFGWSPNLEGEADICVTILEWRASLLKHTNKRLRVRGALSYGVGLAVAQLETSLPGGSCLTENKS